MKTKTIKLAGPVVGDDDKTGYPTHWRVLQITDSLSYAPRQLLNREQVKELCEFENWKVTMVPTDD